MRLLVEAIERAGYAPGTDIAIALDPATSELYRDGSYELKGEGRTLRPDELAELLGRAGPTATRSSRSRTAWPRTTGTAGARSPTRWATACSSSATTCSSRTPSGSRWASSGGVANSILIKVNQIGTLTETLETVALATRSSYTSVMSHRSGETEDTTIADLAVATNCGQIKTGAPARSDRVGEVQPAAAHRGRPRRVGLRTSAATRSRRGTRRMSPPRGSGPVDPLLGGPRDDTDEHLGAERPPRHLARHEDRPARAQAARCRRAARGPASSSDRHDRCRSSIPSASSTPGCASACIPSVGALRLRGQRTAARLRGAARHLADPRHGLARRRAVRVRLPDAHLPRATRRDQAHASTSCRCCSSRTTRSRPG